MLTARHLNEFLFLNFKFPSLRWWSAILRRTSQGLLSKVASNLFLVANLSYIISINRNSLGQWLLCAHLLFVSYYQSIYLPLYFLIQQRIKHIKAISKKVKKVHEYRIRRLRSIILHPLNLLLMRIIVDRRSILTSCRSKPLRFR